MDNKILLVDDESAIRRSLSLNLHQMGYDVEPCKDGISALKKIYLLGKNKVFPETVILDVMLPDIDGIKLGKIIQTHNPETNFIFISGYTDSLDLQEIESFDHSILLQKPVSSESFTSAFNQFVKSKKPESEITEKKNNTRCTSAYVLIKLDTNADFFSVFEKLYYLDDVLYCDSTIGEYDIILLIQSLNSNTLNQICTGLSNSIRAIKSIDCLEVKVPIYDESVKYTIDSIEDFISKKNEFLIHKQQILPNKLCCYILLDVEDDEVDAIYPYLRLHDSVVYCDQTYGQHNTIMLVYASNFNEIDRFIKNKIEYLPGILKITKLPIVNIYKM